MFRLNHWAKAVNDLTELYVVHKIPEDRLQPLLTQLCILYGQCLSAWDIGYPHTLVRLQSLMDVITVGEDTYDPSNSFKPERRLFVVQQCIQRIQNDIALADCLRTLQG